MHTTATATEYSWCAAAFVNAEIFIIAYFVSTYRSSATGGFSRLPKFDKRNLISDVKLSKFEMIVQVQEDARSSARWSQKNVGGTLLLVTASHLEQLVYL